MIGFRCTQFTMIKGCGVNMKSSTVRRSNLSKEKMAVLEALSKYKHDSVDNTPSVYLRSNKEKELDLLWQNFKVSQEGGEKSPVVYLGTGFVAGIVTTSLVFALLGMSMHSITLPSINFKMPVKKESINFVPAAETETATTATTAATTTAADGTEVYTVQSGDTMESILTRFYGGYSQERAWKVMNANNIKNPNKLSIGQKLTIPME